MVVENFIFWNRIGRNIGGGNWRSGSFYLLRQEKSVIDDVGRVAIDGWGWLIRMSRPTDLYTYFFTSWYTSGLKTLLSLRER